MVQLREDFAARYLVSVGQIILLDSTRRKYSLLSLFAGRSRQHGLRALRAELLSAELYGWNAMKWYKHWMIRISVKLANGIAGKLLAALNNEGSDRRAGGAKTKGKPTHPHNSEKAGIEEDDDEYAGPSSLQYDAFHDGGRGD